MQITAFTETLNLKHNTIVLGISLYYSQKYMSGTPLKYQKRWGFRGLRPLTPIKGLCPLDPRQGHGPRTPHKLKWNDAPWLVAKHDIKLSIMCLWLLSVLETASHDHDDINIVYSVENKYWSTLCSGVRGTFFRGGKVTFVYFFPGVKWFFPVEIFLFW